MNVHLWRYLENQRNFPGYHISADADACTALLSWMHKGDGRSSLQLQSAPLKVLQVPNNKGGTAKVICFSSLDVQVESIGDDGYFQFTELGDRLILKCSRQQLECVIEGVGGIPNGEGDYCIGGDGDQVLWFWWYPSEQI